MENSASINEMPHYRDVLSYCFSLFDGDLGDSLFEAAKFCTSHLHTYVQSLIANQPNSDDQTIVDIIRRALHSTDDAFKAYALDDIGTNQSIYIANVADCKAVLCSNDGSKLGKAVYTP